MSSRFLASFKVRCYARLTISEEANFLRVSMATFRENKQAVCGYTFSHYESPCPARDCIPYVRSGLYPVAYEAAAAASPGLEKFRANSVFTASSNSSKILKDKKYFNTVENFRANSVFQGKRRLFKILNDKTYIFNTVNSGHTLFFRASTSCWKILNIKTIFNAVKIFRENSVFRTSASSSNPER